MITILAAFISTIGFSIVFNVSRKHLVVCGFTGAIGWTVYLVTSSLAFSPVFSTFLAALVVAECSYLLAKTRRAPVTVFLIAGLIPLVPGVGLYRTMYALLSSDYMASLEYAILTFQLAGVIAGAIIIASLLPLLWRPNRRPLKIKNPPK